LFSGATHLSKQTTQPLFLQQLPRCQQDKGIRTATTKRKRKNNFSQTTATATKKHRHTPRIHQMAKQKGLKKMEKQQHIDCHLFAAKSTIELQTELIKPFLCTLVVQILSQHSHIDDRSYYCAQVSNLQNNTAFVPSNLTLTFNQQLSFL